METYSYRIHLEPELEGGYTVTVPALPGCITWGKGTSTSSHWLQYRFAWE